MKFEHHSPNPHEEDPLPDTRTGARPDPEKQGSKVSRRKFLKTLGMGAAGLALGEGMLRIGDHLSKDHSDRRDTENQGPAAGEAHISPDALFSYNTPERIDAGTPEQLKQYWIRRYLDPKDKGNDLRIALSRLEALSTKTGIDIDGELARIFAEEGVPPHFRSLAILESYWNTSARSHANARGPFQFIASTGEQFGLVTRRGGKIVRDERGDPIASGRAAAKYLASLYEKYGSWRLALWRYNGSFVRQYARQAKKHGEAVSEKGFLAFMEGRINGIREEVRSSDPVHTVRKGDTLYGIARRFGTSVDALQKANGIPAGNTRITIGQKIRIPGVDGRAKERLFRSRTRGYRENLNYVPHFEAIATVLERQYPPSRLARAGD